MSRDRRGLRRAPEHSPQIRRLSVTPSPRLTVSLGRTIWETLERNDPDSFKEILDQFPERDITLAREMRENTGFTNIPPGERPDFTQGLTTLDQKEEFVTRMNNIAENFNTSEYIPNPDMRNALENQVNEINLSLKDIREGNTQATEPDAIDYYFLQEAEALRYITRPSDPEFWKILDHPDEATQDALIAKVIEENTQGALESINGIHDQLNRPREAALAAHSAMAHVCSMNIKSDLIDEDLPSYNQHLKDIGERSQQFALAVLNGTGFVESSQYQEPPFPQWADQAGSYIAAVNDQTAAVEPFAEEIETDHYKALTFMVDKYTQCSHKLITTDLSNQHDEYQNTIREQQETIRGIQILMRPRE